MQQLRLVIIDDHMLLRETWSFLLNSDPRFAVVGQSGDGEEGIELCKQLRPDLVMLDINLPGMSGMDALPIIKKYAPGTKILAVSLHTQPVYVKKMMQNGASGYVTKNSSREEMINALLEISAGKKYICGEIKNILAHNMCTENNKQSNISLLSLREMEMIDFVRQGLSSKEIAAKVNISVKTVEVHRYNILRKLSLRNSAELVNYINHYNESAAIPYN
jgi:DNA-binding NarL/FixJ family response regulator